MSIENMRKLGWTEEEIADVIECDKKIDKGEKLFELSTGQKAVEKKMKNTGSKTPTAYKFQKRERKADNDKQMIINYIVAKLENWFSSNSQCTFNTCTEVNVINKEREIEFNFNGRKFKLVLSAPRS